ncbi:hypothetical protein [Qingshengfaniella alkalisoli]|uniref:Secreted protein n=1 Tax=Qingshengfaniella alkalisoli TaxID=2599296 RepID=A0A5B8J266_9RHOB|nr:hypothetical protein [Qingshengfaniella alkalisoli]QDY68597.1 hypothetical protein FPZ52_02500 [Qingshengfaniella alkalisoli]
MKIRRACKQLAAVIVASVSFGGASFAATLNEADLASRQVSSDWSRPSEIVDGYDQFIGYGYGHGNEYLYFSGLRAGAQQVKLTLALPEGVNDQWSTMNLNYKTTPFQYSGFEGATPGQFQLNPNTTRETSYTISLGDEFSGALYLALHFNNGPMTYFIEAPGNTGFQPQPPTTPVPLPAGVLLLGSAVAGLGGATALKRCKSKRNQ